MFFYHHAELSILTLNLNSKYSREVSKTFYFCKNSVYFSYLILKAIFSLTQVEKRLKWLLVGGVCGETEVINFLTISYAMKAPPPQMQ